jgi:hypothetical protein
MLFLSKNMTEDDETPSFCKFIIVVVLSIIFLSLCDHETDENNMDAYDRSFFGVAGEGRTRGTDWWNYGTVYEEDGHVSFWGNLGDTNPFYSYWD